MSTSTKPRFVESLEKLLENLRLSGTLANVQGDVHDLVEQALQGAQAQMLAALGFERLADLGLIPYVPNPENEDQQKRLMARRIEIDLTRWHLLQTLRLRFVDESGSLREDYQHEPSLVYSPDELASLQRQIMSAAKEGMAYLEGSISLADTAKDDATQIAVIGHKEITGCEVPVPGGTVFGNRGSLKTPKAYGPTPFE